MKQFNYKALNKAGERINGIIEALSLKQAAKALQEKSYTVISLEEKRSFSLKFWNFDINRGKVSEQTVSNFTRLLSTMLSTGLPLTDAFSNLVTQADSAYFREVLRSILHDVQSGISLSESLTRYPTVFNNLYVNLVKVGEASGKMDEVMGKLADTLESNMEFKSKVKGAMVYPAVIVVAMSLIMVFMLIYVIPQISSVYKNFGAELPLPTRIMIGLSDILKNYILIVAIVLGILYYFYKTFRNNPTIDYFLNNAAYKMPVMGELNSEIVLAVTTRTLSTLLNSGVAILDSLQITSKTLGNDHYKTGLQNASAYVEKGVPLSTAIRRDPTFPMMMSQLMAIGEETGTLDKSLDRLSSFYQEAASRKVKVLTTLLEPVMIIMMGLMVAGLAIAVLLPLFNLASVIK